LESPDRSIIESDSEVTIPNGTHILKGIVHGKTIELDQEPGLPDGQAVSVTVLPSTPTGEGLRRSFASWADGADDLDAFLDQVRRDLI
jgi:hypothetical protein